MEDLDKTLDIMERDKCTALLAENSVRLKKNNIKYTKTNRKHSQEHLDNQYASYDRLIRTLIRQLVTIEKKIRMKYLVPLEGDRAHKLKVSWNTEVENILEDYKKKYRSVHQQRRTGDEFDQQVEETLQKAKISVDTEVEKLLVKLENDIGISEKVQPSELSNIYGVDESVLIDLQVIDHLQNLQINFKQLKDSGCNEEILLSLNEIIRLYAKEIKKVESTVWSGRSADQRKENKMRVARLSINFKETILCLSDLAKQALLSKEKRNDEVILKIRSNLEKLLKSEIDLESLNDNLEPFWAVLN